jgi:3-dehydroquinate synthetase
VQTIVRDLLARGADRRSVLVALGGGIVTDVGGFAASIFMRGIRWIAVPTTTLAMVDAAIGGKTGVDFDGLKNAIGAFHPPLATIVATAFTETESARAVRGGFAEAVKTLAVADAQGFCAVEALGARALDRSERPAWIAASARAKARIVSDDPREEGRRIILNFGHTLGHAIESLGGFERWTHGEAVALGMSAALEIGVREGITPRGLAGRLTSLLAAAGLPTSVGAVDLPGLAAFVRNDKKRLRHTIRFVLLHDLAEPLVQAFDLAELRRLIASLG